MIFEHPYPDYAYLDVDGETSEKRWFGTKGMGVGYVHEDCVAEMVEAAVKAEREACAKLADDAAVSYLSPEYATGQPLSSMGERFACGHIAIAIRDRNT